MFVASWQPTPTHRFGRLYALAGRRPTLLTIILCVIACAPTGCGDSKKREEGRAQLAQQVAEQLQAAKAKADAYDFDGANAILHDLAEDVNKSPFADVATYDKLTADIDGARRGLSQQESEYRKKLREGWKVIDGRLASPADQKRAFAEKKRRQEEERRKREETAKRKAEERRMAEARAKAEAEVHAKEERQRRGAEARTEAIYMARTAVKRALNSPTSATFPVASDRSYGVSQLSKQILETEFFQSADYEVQDGYEVSGWVTAKNAFGVELRQPWFVQFVYLEDKAGTVLPLYIEINGEAAFGKKDAWK